MYILFPLTGGTPIKIKRCENKGDFIGFIIKFQGIIFLVTNYFIVLRHVFSGVIGTFV